MKYFIIYWLGFAGNHGDVCTDDSQCSSGKCLKGCSNGGKFDYKKCLGPINLIFLFLKLSSKMFNRSI